MPRTPSGPLAHASSPTAPASTAAFVGLGLCLFAACIVGILSRPTGFLASFWPANALMLGLLLRLPQLAHWKAWAVALTAFVLADCLTGSDLPTALWLSVANLCGVACGWWFLHRLHPALLGLRRQTSTLYLFAGCALAAAGSTLVGADTGAQLFRNSWSQTALMWFSTELMNFVLIVPLILSAPGRGQAFWPRIASARAALLLLLPLLSVIAAEYAAITLGGPGALAFTVPALLWCALSYRLFTTTLLSMLVCTWKVACVSMGVFDFTPLHLEAAVSLRLGLTLLSLGPLAVACSQVARNELMRRLDHAVNHDFLTSTLARGAFLSQGQRLLERLHRQAVPSAVLMLDIDHFKRVNDLHGHPAGDALLCALAQTVSQVLRPQDLLGRMGGEEFAVLLPGVPAATAQQVATRICAAVRDQRLPLPGGAVLQATVSIGLVLTDGSPQTLEGLLHAADAALYQAKAAGRDRWQLNLARADLAVSPLA